MQVLNCAVSWATVAYGLAVFVVITFVGYTFVTILDFVARKIVERTKTSLDDELYKALRGPVKLFFAVFGAYVGAMQVCPELLFYDKGLNELFALASIVVVGYAVARIVDALVSWYTRDVAAAGLRGPLRRELFPLGRKAARIIVYGVVLIVLLGRLGIEVGPLIAGLGIAGLAVALALQDSLSNFFAGVYLLSDKPVKIGDYISLDSETSGVAGFVREIGWRSTKIETSVNSIIIVPNTEMAKRVLFNFSEPDKKRRVYVEFGVAYDTDVEKLERILMECFESLKKRKTELGLDESFAPLLRFYNFGEYALVFRFNFQIKNFADQAVALSEMRKEILKQFRKNKIEIPFPTRIIYSEGAGRRKAG